MVDLWNLHTPLVHIGLQKLQIMPKLYLGPGLSRRVHQALSRRLEQFMAANAAAPAAPVEPELPLSVNPPLTAQAGAVDTDSEKGEEHGTHPPEEANKSPTEKEDRDDDRSRSPRPRVPEPDPNDPASLLASTTALAIGVTSMVGALKGSSAKLEILIQQSQNLQRDLCKSLETVSSAVNNMARGIVSLSAGVSHNTGRVGAVCGEYTKLRKHLEWAMSMGDVLKKNAKNRTERDQALKELMDQLFESMDKLQENMQKIALRIEKAPVGHEGTTGYDPPQPPTGHLGSPSVTPLTPAPGMILGAGIPPPPAVPPAPMVPPKPMVPPQPPLPVVKFVGYSPAKMGELPMSHPYQESTLPSSWGSDGAHSVRFTNCSPWPATGTAAFAPLGYVQVKGTSEYRRVYP